MMEYKLNILEDEFADELGLPICKKCLQPRYYLSKEDNICVRAACECQSKQFEIQRDNEISKCNQQKLQALREYSLMGKKYFNCTFENSTINEINKVVYEKCQKYTEHAKIMCENGLGLYIFGPNGSGKTHLLACICNRLIEFGYRCYFTNFFEIFKAIKQANFIKDISESEFLNKINEVDFLFIDDLGKEFLAREVGQNSAKWLEEKIFDVINKRYNSKLPIIFSGNYSIQELGTVLDLDRSILERINEISARCLYLTGQNFRKNLQQSNSELLKKLGI